MGHNNIRARSHADRRAITIWAITTYVLVVMQIVEPYEVEVDAARQGRKVLEGILQVQPPLGRKEGRRYIPATRQHDMTCDTVARCVNVCSEAGRLI